MARKQTRRSVSLKPETYQRVKDWCDAYKTSMSSFVEERIADFFGGVERTAKSVQEAEGEWTPSFPELPQVPDRYPGSDIRKERVERAEPKPVRGGGVHEF